MATPFDRIMMTIRPHLPGAVDAAIRVELFGVCDTFFDLSNAWREEIEINVKANKQYYDLMPTAGRVNRLMGVGNKDGMVVRGCLISDDGRLRLPYVPVVDGDLIAVVALTVSDPTAKDRLPVVPWGLIQEYQQDIIHGICSSMMFQPSKPYTNPALGAAHGVAFRSGAARAKVNSNIGNTYGSQRWAYPQTFNNTN